MTEISHFHTDISSLKVKYQNLIPVIASALTENITLGTQLRVNIFDGYSNDFKKDTTIIRIIFSVWNINTSPPSTVFT